MKIVCLGDSLTWGGYGGNYVNELAALLPEHQIVNAGVGGNTVVNLLRRLESDVLPHQPDAVFIMVGGNDAISYHHPKTRSYYTKAQQIETGFISPEQFETTYRELLTQIRLAHLIAWVGLQPTEYSVSAVAELRVFNDHALNAARALTMPTLDLLDAIVKPQTLHERDPITMDFILTIGQREKHNWMDYETVRARDGFTYTFDGVHPTPAGAKTLATLIAAFIGAQTA